VFPWDVVVTVLPGGAIFLDVRDALEFSLHTVNETAPAPPPEQDSGAKPCYVFVTRVIARASLCWCWLRWLWWVSELFLARCCISGALAEDINGHPQLAIEATAIHHNFTQQVCVCVCVCVCACACACVWVILSEKY
jgi:hypothetical protein